MLPFVWCPGSATGVGSLPGTDILAAVRLALDECAAFPFLPELPARGPGAEMTGRTLGLLPDFAAQWGPTGWSLSDRPGRDTRRAQAFLRQDLDTLEEAAEGFTGPLKVQVTGPWTLAATVELRSGRAAVADSGARRDLAQALGAALVEHVADLTRRLPGATLVLQVDEPALPNVLRGGIPRPSGWGRLAAVEAPEVELGLAVTLRDLPHGLLTLAHCCAAEPPVGLLRAAGFGALSLDASLVTPADDDAMGEVVEAGLGLLLGITTDTSGSTGSGGSTGSTAVRLAEPLTGLWSRLGQAPERLAEQVVVTPTCGLASSSPAQARAALVQCVAVGRSLVENPEGVHG
jgi:hypothetical protein